jgi:hypothetical protein
MIKTLDVAMKLRTHREKYHMDLNELRTVTEQPTEIPSDVTEEIRHDKNNEKGCDELLRRLLSLHPEHYRVPKQWNERR